MGFIPGIIVILEFLRTGYYPDYRRPFSQSDWSCPDSLSLMVGLVLHTVARRFQELDLQLRNLGREIEYYWPSTGGYHHHILARSLLLRFHHQTFPSMTVSQRNFLLFTTGLSCALYPIDAI
jgi:hypothetical protein